MLRLARVAAATAALAIRRLRHRWGIACASAAAVAIAVGLLGAVSLVAARSGETAQRAEVERWSPRQRLVQLTVRRDERETPAQTLRDAERRFAPLARVLGRPATMVVAGPVSPADENGVRIVTFPGATAASGRLPRACDASRCEVAALGRAPAIGSRLRLGSARARVVGGVRLPAAVRPPQAILRGRAVLAPSLAMLTGPAASASASAVLSAAVRPEILETRDAGAFARRLRAEAARAERGRTGVAVRAPVAALDDIDRRVRTARHRLVLIGGQAAALLVAFLALLGTAFRRDAALLDDQLASFGAYRRQSTASRALEVAPPAVAGAAVALGSTAAIGALLGVAALTGETLAVAGAVLAVSILASLVAAHERPEARRARAIDVAALGSLALIAWQAVATGGLDSAQVAGDAALPVLLLVPTLAVFTGAVVVSRALPLAFRWAERLARRRRMGTRLALLSLARGGGLAAAATTFLAVALGTALFALNYRATLAGQLEDSAAFAAGAPWRVVAAPGHGVAPLDRFGTRPARVMRFPAHLTLAGAEEGPVDGTLLALPASDLRAVSGWRPGFSGDSRAAIVARLEAGGGAFRGPRLDGNAVRLWARSSVAGVLVLELLEPGETFARVELGPVDDGWRQLRAPLPRRTRRAEIAGITLSSGVSTAGAQLELGPLMQRGARWTVVDRLEDWTVSTGRPGEQFPPLPVGLVHAPIRRGVRIELGGGSVPLLRPNYPVPPEIPALVNEDLAARAVDGRLSASVLGWPLQLRVVARSSLFPTVIRGARRFAVVDYDSLFAALNADRPGDGVAGEAWFFGAPPRGLRPDERLVTHRQLAAAARRDALATGASMLLLVTAGLAVALAATGLLLTAASAARAEGGELAAWLALGAAPATLAASVRMRILLLYGAGTAAAAIGALLALRLVAALVAVAGGGRVSLPPILARVDWPASAALVVVSGAATTVIAVRFARATTRRLRARRLRA